MCMIYWVQRIRMCIMYCNPFTFVWYNECESHSLYHQNAYNNFFAYDTCIWYMKNETCVWRAYETCVWRAYETCVWRAYETCVWRAYETCVWRGYETCVWRAYETCVWRAYETCVWRAYETCVWRGYETCVWRAYETWNMRMTCIWYMQHAYDVRIIHAYDVRIIQPIPHGVTFWKAQSSNVSFATFLWKERFKLWALSFETAFAKVTPSGIGCDLGPYTYTTNRQRPIHIDTHTHYLSIFVGQLRNGYACIRK